jgi:hypothetical protein
VTENELFLGILLAHPDSRGEMRVFLDHFGLMARDLLPDDYPSLTAENLERATAKVAGADPDTWSPSVNEILDTANSIGGGDTQLPHVMSALLSRPTPWQARLQTALSRLGVQVTVLASELGGLLLPADDANQSQQQLNLSGDRTAGEQIRDWLRRRFPRQPAAVAGFTSDAPNPESDFVGVGIEADAFAYLVASKALTPPLAIGLFGNWGSGKSFLMAKIKQRVTQLTKLATDEPSPKLQVWGNVAPIEFNAWQYVETDLWAALLHHIFARLTPETQQQLAELSDSRQKAQIQLEVQQVAAVAAQQDLERHVIHEAQANTNLIAATDRLERTRSEAASVRDAMVAKSLEGSARRVLKGRLVETAVKSLGKDGAQAIVTAERSARDSRKLLLRRQYWTRWRVVYVLAAVALVPVVAWLADLLFASPAATWVLALLPVAVVVLKAAADVLADLTKAQEAAERAVDEELAKVLVDAKDARSKAAKRLRNARQRTAKARQLKVTHEQRRSELEEKVQQLTPGSLYREFLAGRSSTEDYRKRLSLVTTIHGDLKRLADLTRLYNTDQSSTTTTPDTVLKTEGQGPPNRIVLYIDDLDRCPAERVVEVLEAVHLLLAFELFVVIVAVDTRWLVSALPRALPDLTADPAGRGEAPSPMDYIEKIFQIPFWVEPLDDAGRQRLLRGLLLPTVAAPEAAPTESTGGALRVTSKEKELVDAMLTRYRSWLDVDARRLSITADELAFLESLAPLMASTPRQVKRFVNTCQLLLAMAPPLSGEGAHPTERMATCFMAAVHDSMPLVAAVAASSPAHPSPTWHSVLTALGPDELRDECERLRRWFAARNADPANVGNPPFEHTPIQRFLNRWDVIKRIRFQAADRPGDP